MTWWRIRKRDADLERELRSDLELEAEEQRESGLSAEDARYAAQRALGNLALIKEQTYEAWAGRSSNNFCKTCAMRSDSCARIQASQQSAQLSWPLESARRPLSSALWIHSCCGHSHIPMLRAL